MSKEKEVNIVRSVLRNEITWLITLILSVWGFVVTVILPLQSLQIQVAQVQHDVSDGKIDIAKIANDNNNIINNI